MKGTVGSVDAKALPIPSPEKISWEDFERKENAIRLKKFGLYDLEKHPTLKDDLEIRVWQISGLAVRTYRGLGVKESVFILKQTNGNWSAKVFKNTIDLKSDVEKLIKTKFDAPKSGWENVWQNFVSSELLTYPDSVSGELEIALDAGSCIIETKVGGIFKTYKYAGSQEVRDEQHTAKILNIIAEEFYSEDFKATKKFE